MLQRCFEYESCYFVLVYDKEESDCVVIKDGNYERSLYCGSDKDLKKVESRIRNGCF